MFGDMMDGIKEESVGLLFNLEVQVQENPIVEEQQDTPPGAVLPGGAPPAAVPAVGGPPSGGAPAQGGAPAPGRAPGQGRPAGAHARRAGPAAAAPAGTGS